jgi:cytochrome c-type biogenesis protein CcmH
MNARPLLLGLALFAYGLSLHATKAEEARPLADDPVAEQRLLAITSELRCLVCQNETIAASNADLANDLRVKVRDMIQSGKSDDEIIDFMVTRYGDFVLYRPPVKPVTFLLWGGPLLFLIAGLGGLRFYLVRRNRRLAMDVALSEAEKRHAEALFAGDVADPHHPETSPS